LIPEKRNLSVCLSPALLPSYVLENTIVVVIDIFRASSSICYGIANGAEAIIPVSTVEECLSYKEQGFLLAAERNGLIVEGFDFGNSPFSYVEDKVKGETIVLTTTNGTRALKESLEASEIIVGSFLNLSAVCRWLQVQKKDIILLCAGWKNHFCLEDTLFAGAVVEKLYGIDICLDDSAMAAGDLYALAKNDLAGYLSKSSHGERLKKLNIEKDIAFCLQIDTIDTIPILKGDKLLKLKISESKAVI
jgi:2-phosphosulfolactate phosphatase